MGNRSGSIAKGQYSGRPDSGPDLAPILKRAYELMLGRFGHQGWWPGETPFEICVGAILTQNTNWKNVERAIENLKFKNVLEPLALHRLSEREVAELIRPAGYYNVKARRLKAFVKVLVEEFGGNLESLFRGELDRVRQRLLQIDGIGFETADSMILYAGERPTFVVDAYTKRIFHRHSWCGEGGSGRFADRIIEDCKAEYDELKRLCESALGYLTGKELVELWKDYHAQLVAVGKHFCRRRKPRCHECPLKEVLSV